MEIVRTYKRGMYSKRFSLSNRENKETRFGLGRVIDGTELCMYMRSGEWMQSGKRKKSGITQWIGMFPFGPSPHQDVDTQHQGGEMGEALVRSTRETRDGWDMFWRGACGFETHLF